MSIRSLMRAIPCGFVLLTVSAPVLWAHAILIEATPAKDGSVKGPDFSIHLKFNSRIDASRSQISLVFKEKTAYTPKIEKQALPNVISAKVSGLKPGTYHLRWQVLASDGHITRGEYGFEVK